MKYYFSKNNRAIVLLLVGFLLSSLTLSVKSDAGCQEGVFGCYLKSDRDALFNDLRKMESKGLVYKKDEIEILDYFVLSGSLKSVDVLVNNGAEPDQSKQRTLEYLLIAISDWDAGIVYGAKKREDFLEILMLLIDSGAEYDFYRYGMHFVENFIVYYCGADGFVYDKEEVSEVVDKRGRIRYSSLRKMDNIERAAVQGVYSVQCVEDMKSAFLKD
ncbi:MAG: hypothetical protein AWU57_2687 [Marinobacter sp. T13-3]|nr:MAG: hypothetical protein AWU57_2687 [Marinobacter sp. T13-3]